MLGLLFQILHVISLDSHNHQVKEVGAYSVLCISHPHWQQGLWAVQDFGLGQMYIAEQAGRASSGSFLHFPFFTVEWLKEVQVLNKEVGRGCKNVLGYVDGQVGRPL